MLTHLSDCDTHRASLHREHFLTEAVELLHHVHWSSRTRFAVTLANEMSGEGALISSHTLSSGIAR